MCMYVVYAYMYVQGWKHGDAQSLEKDLGQFVPINFQFTPSRQGVLLNL